MDIHVQRKQNEKYRKRITIIHHNLFNYQYNPCLNPLSKIIRVHLS